MKKSSNFGGLMTKTSASKVKVQANAKKAVNPTAKTMSKAGVSKVVKLVGNNLKTNGTKLVQPRVGAVAVRSKTEVRKTPKMNKKNIPVGKTSVSLALGKLGKK